MSVLSRKRLEIFGSVKEMAGKLLFSLGNGRISLFVLFRKWPENIFPIKEVAGKCLLRQGNGWKGNLVSTLDTCCTAIPGPLLGPSCMATLPQTRLELGCFYSHGNTGNAISSAWKPCKGESLICQGYILGWKSRSSWRVSGRPVSSTSGSGVLASFS